MPKSNAQTLFNRTMKHMSEVYSSSTVVVGNNDIGYVDYLDVF